MLKIDVPGRRTEGITESRCIERVREGVKAPHSGHGSPHPPPRASLKS